MIYELIFTILFLIWFTFNYLWSRYLLIKDPLMNKPLMIISDIILSVVFAAVCTLMFYGLNLFISLL